MPVLFEIVNPLYGAVDRTYTFAELFVALGPFRKELTYTAKNGKDLLVNSQGEEVATLIGDNHNAAN